MTLIEKQKAFPLLLATFYTRLSALGYEFTLGDSYRDPALARYYADLGIGIKNSNHCLRLAQDINLFKNGVFLVNDRDYKEAGLLWESLSTSNITCSWGGHFGDGDHFSIVHNGVK